MKYILEVWVMPGNLQALTVPGGQKADTIAGFSYSGSPVFRNSSNLSENPRLRFLETGIKYSVILRK